MVLVGPFLADETANPRQRCHWSLTTNALIIKALGFVVEIFDAGESYWGHTPLSWTYDHNDDC